MGNRNQGETGLLGSSLGVHLALPEPYCTLGLVPQHLGNQLETRSQREERREGKVLGAGKSYVTPRCHVTPEVTLKA